MSLNLSENAHADPELDWETAAPTDTPLSPASPVGRPRRWFEATPATYLLLGINVVVYAIMFRHGPIPVLLRAHDWSSLITAPFDLDTLARYGGTASDLVQQNNQWWRLITGCFVHVSLLHIALNMWCLWNLGLLGEPLLGRRGLVCVYLLTGAAGMLLSTTFALLIGQPGLVAGASGSIFGIAGILIILLSNRKLRIPWDDLRALRRQVIFFAVANLAIGMAPGLIARAPAAHLAAIHLNPAILPRIDNTAHLGGFLMGLLLGLPLFARMTAGRPAYRRRQAVTYVGAALLFGAACYAVALAAAEIPAR